MACSAKSEPAEADAIDACALCGGNKADSLIPAEGTCEAKGMLAFVNEASPQTLEAALDSRVAAGIVNGRPIADLEALDAVAFVGPIAMERIVEAAQDAGRFDSCQNDCGPFVCEIFCEHGLVTDENGCSKCECAQPQECPPVGCAIFCEHGQVTDENGCAKCECNQPTECPPVVCEIFCEHGQVTNDKGCAVCECAEPPECPAVPCAIFCEHGQATDDKGCVQCECNQPPECPPVVCELFCENGQVVDDDGCAQCKCNP